MAVLFLIEPYKTFKANRFGRERLEVEGVLSWERFKGVTNPLK